MTTDIQSAGRHQRADTAALEQPMTEQQHPQGLFGDDAISILSGPPRSLSRSTSFSWLRRTRATCVATVLTTALLMVAGCGGESSTQDTSTVTAASAAQMTPAELYQALGCTEERKTGGPVPDHPGATHYPCVGSIAKSMAWYSAYLDYSYGESRKDPGPAPKAAHMVFFDSQGARDVYHQSDVAAASQRANETNPRGREADDLEGNLPDVVGPNWIVWGNDHGVMAEAINASNG